MTRLLLTTTEAAQALGLGRSKLYELMRAGALDSVLIGGARRIPADALTDYVASLRPRRPSAARATAEQSRPVRRQLRPPASTETPELPFA